MEDGCPEGPEVGFEGGGAGGLVEGCYGLGEGRDEGGAGGGRGGEVGGCGLLVERGVGGFVGGHIEGRRLVLWLLGVAVVV